VSSNVGGDRRPQAVMFGAGNVGRGFLGQLFAESGYLVVFVDIDDRLVGALAGDEQYTLRLVDNEGQRDLSIGPVTAVLASDTDQVAKAIAEAGIAATAVGARALEHIAPTLAAGIARRQERGVEESLNIIVCENLKGAASILRGMVSRHLNEAQRSYVDSHVGFVNTVIGRMVPEVPASLREEQPSLIIAEPYKELPVDAQGFVGPVPEIVGMEAHDGFELYTARKLYLHNAGHAILGYLGYQRGHTYGYDALADHAIHRVLEAALDESAQGIAARYGAELAWLQTHVDDLLRRFDNRALGDPVDRLARDPLRKLAREDRLVGAARLAESAGVTPKNLAWGIAGALAYDDPGDAIAAELAERVADEGVGSVMQQVAGISPSEPLGELVLARFKSLSRGDPWA
jgi:mannitol-1-phosphate 5-dehydrogenase